MPSPMQTKETVVILAPSTLPERAMDTITIKAVDYLQDEKREYGDGQEYA